MNGSAFGTGTPYIFLGEQDITKEKKFPRRFRMIFRQLFDRVSCTYTYLLADPLVQSAMIIDPVYEHIDRDAKLIRDLNLDLKYIVDSHVHADHITGAHGLRKHFSNAQIVSNKKCGVTGNDQTFVDGDVLECGSLRVTCLETPGHTSGCSSYLAAGYDVPKVFTGDTLFIRGCGRTDFQEGSSKQLYKSVLEKLFTLPDETEVYPGHDYNGFTSSTIGEEKLFNPRLNQDEKHFESVMAALKLAVPAKIKESVPANMKCGDC
jgi:sulfur dioxygenase